MKAVRKQAKAKPAASATPEDAALLCPGCARDHTAESLEDEGGFARCASCSAVFRVPETEAWSALAFQSAPVDAPANVRVGLAPGGGPTRDLNVAWRYRHPQLGMLVAIALACVAAVVVMSVFAASSSAPVLLTLAVDAGLAIGFLIAGYFVLMSFIGWQWLDLHRSSAGKAVLRFGALPLPLPKVVARFDADAIRDVFVRREDTTVTNAGTERRTATTYDVVLFAEGTSSHAARFADVRTALFCAETLRGALGLERGPSRELVDRMGELREILERAVGAAVKKQSEEASKRRAKKERA